MPLTHHRTSATGAVLALAVLLTGIGACASDATRPLARGELRGELVSPDGPVGAAVLEFRGIADVTAVSGRVFSERSGDVLHAVFILESPGQLEFTVRLTDATGTPSATVVEIADGANTPPASLEGYHVRFSL